MTFPTAACGGEGRGEDKEEEEEVKYENDKREEVN